MKETRTLGDTIIVYTDGGSRGNPGPAAIGIVLAASKSRTSSDLFGRGAKEYGRYKEYGEYVGVKTNNQAEYLAVIFALKKLKQMLGKKRAKETGIDFRIDSELVVKQLNGKYKILEAELQPLFLEVWNARLDFKNILFSHVPRGENRMADGIVNKVLDRERTGRRF